MSSATGRRLDVLAILQSNPGITSDLLAARLEVTERTIRRDIAHLRDLGYRIDAAPGRYGGYSLAGGSSMPPLVLDADEALAVALGLRATMATSELGPAAVTALAKLTETVPRRLRPRLEAIAGTEVVAGGEDRRVDPGVLVALALACRANEAVRFTHTPAGSGEGRARDAQPHRLVAAGSRWYLVACEAGDDRWRTYAVDRITDVRPLGTRLRAPAPPDDAAAFVAETLAEGRRRHRVRVRLYTSGDLARSMIPPTVGRIDDENDDSCILTFGTDDLDSAARWLVFRNIDADVLEPPELTDRLHALGAWLTARF